MTFNKLQICSISYRACQRAICPLGTATMQCSDRWLLGVIIRKLIVQNHIQQGFVRANSVLVVDKT